MKPFRWDPKKDAKLRLERGVSFTDVLASYYAGGVLKDFKHPNTKRYPNQRVMIMRIRDYAYIVPYVEADEAIDWKTIIPSRKMTQKYLRRKSHEQG